MPIDASPRRVANKVLSELARIDSAASNAFSFCERYESDMTRVRDERAHASLAARCWSSVKYLEVAIRCVWWFFMHFIMLTNDLPAKSAAALYSPKSRHTAA